MSASTVTRNTETTCCFCGHPGATGFHYEHVGGRNDRELRCCADSHACIKRVAAKKIKV